MTTKSYRVRQDVEWVNGARVPSNRKVMLSEAEARYDLDHGRVEPYVTRQRSVAPEGSGDGRD
jgi:hypothetical protein